MSKMDAEKDEFVKMACKALLESFQLRSIIKRNKSLEYRSVD